MIVAILLSVIALFEAFLSSYLSRKGTAFWAGKIEQFLGNKNTISDKFNNWID